MPTREDPETAVYEAVRAAVGDFLHTTGDTYLTVALTAAGDDSRMRAWREALARRVAPVVERVWLSAYRAVTPRPGPDAAPGAASFAAGLPDRSHGFLDRITDRLSTAATRARAHDMPGQQLRQQLAELLAAGEWDGQARTIARIETTATLSAGTLAAAFHRQAQGGSVNWVKTWMSRDDPKVRPTHRHADGQVRPLADPFTIGDASLQFPADPTGPPGEVFNCRCRLAVRPLSADSFAALTDGEPMSTPPATPNGAPGRVSFTIRFPDSLTAAASDGSDAVTVADDGTWSGPIGLVDSWSADDRLLLAPDGGQLATRPLPLPVLVQDRLNRGHDGAQLGLMRLDSVAVQDQYVIGRGQIDMADPDGVKLANKISGKYIRFVSMDVDDALERRVCLDDNRAIVRGCNPDTNQAARMGRIYETWRVMGATVLAHPAFPDAAISMDNTPGEAALADTPAAVPQDPAVPDPAAADGGGPTHAGIVLKAADTGRVIMLQRALVPDDPAGGQWEWPGGGIEPGETPKDAAVREFQEETGSTFPGELAHLAATWTSSDGVYQAFVFVIPSETDVPINPDQDSRATINPDDPDGDQIETVAWWDPASIPDMPALRQEVRDSTPWDVVAQASMESQPDDPTATQATDTPGTPDGGVAEAAQLADSAGAPAVDAPAAAGQCVVPDGAGGWQPGPCDAAGAVPAGPDGMAPAVPPQAASGPQDAAPATPGPVAPVPEEEGDPEDDAQPTGDDGDALIPIGEAVTDAPDPDDADIEGDGEGDDGLDADDIAEVVDEVADMITGEDEDDETEEGDAGPDVPDNIRAPDPAAGGGAEDVGNGCIKPDGTGGYVPCDCSDPDAVTANVDGTPLTYGVDDTADDRMQALAASAFAHPAFQPDTGAFRNPRFTEPTLTTVTDDGRVYGHLALWGVPHVAYQGRKVLAPHSPTRYDRFHVRPIHTSEGIVEVGVLAMGTNHAAPYVTAGGTVDHYDSTGSIVAAVRCGEDAYGIWMAGVLLPDVSADQRLRLSLATFSGDWRDEGRGLDLKAALAVPAGHEGFYVPKNAPTDRSGYALVASGALTADHVIAARTAPPAPPGKPCACAGRHAEVDMETRMRAVVAEFMAERAERVRRAALAAEKVNRLGQRRTAALVDRNKLRIELAVRKVNKLKGRAVKKKTDQTPGLRTPTALAAALEGSFPGVKQGTKTDAEFARKNWVQQTGKGGHLPSYIKRVADHLTAKGFDTSHAIATAVNVAKKTCASGDLNFPGRQNVKAASRSEACSAVAEWERMKAAARAS